MRCLKEFRKLDVFARAGFWWNTPRGTNQSKELSPRPKEKFDLLLFLPFYFLLFSYESHSNWMSQSYGSFSKTTAYLTKTDWNKRKPIIIRKKRNSTKRLNLTTANQNKLKINRRWPRTTYIDYKWSNKIWTKRSKQK